MLINGHEPCPEGFQTPNSKQIVLDCCGEKASYLLVPSDAGLTHDDLVKRIQRLA